MKSKLRIEMPRRTSSRRAPKSAKSRKCRFRVALVALCLLAAAGARATQIDPAAFAAKIAISFTGYSGSEKLENFPALVKLSAEKGFQYAKCKLEKGGDLRFADADGNLLASEVDTWDPSGTSLVWVKVPELTKTATIFAYYGWKGPGAVPAVTASDVWSEGYAAVWHLGESDIPMRESSGISTPFSSKTGAVGFEFAGPVGHAVDFSGASWGANLAADDDDDLDGFSDFTVEMWLRLSSELARASRILSKAKDSSTDTAYQFIANKDTSTLRFTVNPSAAGEARQAWDYVAVPSIGAWHHVAYQYDSNDKKAIAWLDRERKQYVSKTIAPIHASAAPLLLGTISGGFPFPGQIDEVRISNKAHSKDWMEATHDTVANDDFCAFSFDTTWDDYSHRFSVTFTGVDEGVSLTNFPVLVRVAEYDEATGKGIRGFDYDDCQISGGGDLRFADADGNLLASEVDTWNSSGESLVWVKVPTLTASTEITAYYGNAKPHTVTASDVWANGFKAVWHLGDVGVSWANSVSGAAPLDLWVAGGKKTAAVDSVVSGQAGVIGNAVLFGQDNRKGALSTKDASVSLSAASEFTVEVWAWQDDHDPGSAAAQHVLFREMTSSYGHLFWISEQTATGIMAPQGRFENGTTTWSSLVPSRGDWHHFAFAYDATAGGTSLLDGNVAPSLAQPSGTLTEDTGTARQLFVGAFTSSNDTQTFPGKIDEVRISNVVRDAAWLKATHDTVANAAFATYGRAKENAVKGTVVFFR